MKKTCLINTLVVSVLAVHVAAAGGEAAVFQDCV